LILTTILQVVSGGAAVARIATDDYRSSRSWAILAQTAVAADYLLKSLADEDAVYLVGLIYSVLVTCRTALVLFIPALDRSRRARTVVCLTFLVIICSLMLTTDIILGAELSVVTLLPFVAAACGAGTDISNSQITRRWLFLALGLSQLGFAAATAAWGLAAKAMISDIGASVFYLCRRRDDTIGYRAVS
jgi:hypothetical protein